MRLSNRFLFTARRNFSDVVDTPIIKLKRNTSIKKSNRPIIKSQRKVNAEHMLKAVEMGLSWRIVGATYVIY